MEVEDQRAVRPDVGRAAFFAVGKIRGQVDAPLRADRHAGERFLEAFDDLQRHRHGFALGRGVELLAIDERALVVHHELLVVLLAFLGRDVFLLAALLDDLVLQAALGGDHALTLAVFLEELLAGFEILGGQFLLAVLEQVAERLHGGLEFRLLHLRLAALERVHEALEESVLLEVVRADAEAAELLGKRAAGAETERVGRIGLHRGGVGFRLGGHFDGRSGGFSLRGVGGRGLGGTGGGETDEQGTGNEFADHGISWKGRERKGAPGACRERVFAPESAGWTRRNKLLFGGGKPNHGTSPRGCRPVDPGYNVEESLNGVILYALEENDREMLDLLADAMNRTALRNENRKPVDGDVSEFDLRYAFDATKTTITGSRSPSPAARW